MASITGTIEQAASDLKNTNVVTNAVPERILNANQALAQNLTPPSARAGGGNQMIETSPCATTWNALRDLGGWRVYRRTFGLPVGLRVK